MTGFKGPMYYCLLNLCDKQSDSWFGLCREHEEDWHFHKKSTGIRLAAYVREHDEHWDTTYSPRCDFDFCDKARFQPYVFCSDHAQQYFEFSKKHSLQYSDNEMLSVFKCVVLDSRKEKPTELIIYRVGEWLK